MELKEVIHFYVGCWVIYPGMVNKRKLTGPWLYSLLEKGIDVKPVLRPLSSMTEEEVLIFLRMAMNYHDIKDINVDNIEISFAGRYNEGKRYFNNYQRFDELNAEQFAYLLSKSFDLFNLIESGQAIDASALTQNS